MKNEKLQQSETLAKYFSPRRDEAPLLSVPEIEKLLAKRAMLPDSSHAIINLRRIIMTLSALAGIAAIAYFAFFNTPSSNIKGTQGTNATQGSYMTHPSHTTTALPELSQLATPPSTPAKATQQLRKPADRGPWSAGNDQIYADLTPEELAKLGIVVNGDTILTYKRNDRDSVERTYLAEYAIPGIKYKGHSIGGEEISATAPNGVNPPKFYPVLMTFSNGNGAAYRIENGKSSERAIFSEKDPENALREWLKKPGVPGYHAVAYQHTYSFFDNKSGERRDSVKIVIGKNLPQPSFMPLMKKPVQGYSDTVSTALLAMCHYYDGSSNIKPDIQWPNTLHIKVDTMTAEDFLDQLDQADNSASMLRLRSITARLNELIPVIVRMKLGSGAPDSNDFIFWYEPSDELFAALPPAQAEAFRQKLAQPPHCLTAPNAVLTQAEITYCVAEPQGVDIFVHDLTGRLWISTGDFAHAGDNVYRLNTETLPSGIYLVTVRDADSNERTRRIWVENAHPKSGAEYMDDVMNNTLKNGMNAGIGPQSMKKKQYIGLPTIPMVKLSDDDLAQLGIESDEYLSRFYQRSPWVSTKVLAIAIMRNGGVQIQNVDSEYVHVQVPDFHPQFVTDGIGGKRALANDSSFSFFADTTYDINTLIPLLLKADYSNDSLSSRDIIFWYQPTPDFLALLPDSEKAAAEEMSGTPKGKNDAAALVQLHGAIQTAAVYPNPSQGRFSVNLTLNALRTITITLRNLLGQEAAPPVQALQEGMYSTLTNTTYTFRQSLDCTNVAEGVYLLDITSDAGERYIERIVIAH